METILKIDVKNKVIREVRGKRGVEQYQWCLQQFGRRLKQACVVNFYPEDTRHKKQCQFRSEWIF